MGLYTLGVIVAFAVSVIASTIWITSTVDTEDTSEIFTLALASLVVIIVASFLSWLSIATLVIVRATIIISDYYKHKKES